MANMYDTQAAMDRQIVDDAYKAGQLGLGGGMMFASSGMGDLYNQGLMGLAGMMGGEPDPRIGKQQAILEIQERFPEPDTFEEFMELANALRVGGFNDAAEQALKAANDIRSSMPDKSKTKDVIPAIQWLKDKLLVLNNSKQTDSLYAKADKNEKITIIPALTGLGAPHWKPNVRGGIFGLTRNTGIPEIVKATLDSLAFQTLDLIEGMQKDSLIKIKEMRVDGGMVANDNFIQSLSNILQIKIIRPSNIETTGLGVAYLAALNAGLIKDTHNISKLWKSSKIYKPKIDNFIIKKQVKKWKVTVSFLIKYHS